MASRGRLPPRRAVALARFLLAAAAASAAFPHAAFPLGEPRPVDASVEGAVRRPGSYRLSPGATLSTLLLSAGGFADNAFAGGAILRRTSARAAQETELRETADRLGRDAGDAAKTRDTVRPVLQLLASLSPSGRLPVRLSHPRLLKGSPEDLPLEEGDALFVPVKEDTVAVSGAVPGAPASVPFTAKLPYKEYIRRAGGFAEGADRDRIYLLRADGTTALLSPGFISWNAAAGRWEVTALAGSTPALGPGDTIVVPRLPPPGLPPKAARELAGILMRAAEIAGGPAILP